MGKGFRRDEIRPRPTAALGFFLHKDKLFKYALRPPPLAFSVLLFMKTLQLCFFFGLVANPNSTEPRFLPLDFWTPRGD